MANVIAIVGAGGKTGLIRKLYDKYTDLGHSCVITTTTKMWAPPLLDNNKIKTLLSICQDNPLKGEYPGDEAYYKACSEFDYVLVEADGAKSFPVKFPRPGEPVIPDNVNKIIVVMGSHGIGRPLGEVAFAMDSIKDDIYYDNGLKPRNIGKKEALITNDIDHKKFSITRGIYNKDTLVTSDILQSIAFDFYIDPLKKHYPNASFEYYLSDMYQNKPTCQRTMLALLCSGQGSRFGSNKLLTEYRGIPLYEHMHQRLKELAGKRGYELVLVTCHNEIMAGSNDNKCIFNSEASEGISASIRLATKEALLRGCDSIAFFVADAPWLPLKDIDSFLNQFLHCQKSFSCMCFEGIYSNPAAFMLTPEISRELLSLSGDRGAMRIIKKAPWDAHLYPISSFKLKDIDVPEDLDI